MKSRIITGVVGTSIALVVLLFLPAVFVNIAISILCALAMIEILVVTHFVDHRGLMIASVLYSMATPFFMLTPTRLPALIVLFVYVIVLAVIQVIYYNTLKVERTGFVFFISLIVPFAFSSIAYLRDVGRHGLFYVFLVFIMPWLCDIGAYFVGTFLGKHKLCPGISPKKTVEGLIGGVLASIAASVLAGWLYQVYFLNANASSSEVVYLWQIAIVALVMSPLSVLGDLFASIIKRQCRVKDFGHIMPGHGGVMDRFDSMLFVAPLFFVLIQYLPLIYTRG